MRAQPMVTACALLALGLATRAWAGDELYLRWNNCIGDGGTYNRVFACDVNAGTEVLVGSFRLGATTDSVGGMTIVVQITAMGPTLPSWWDLRGTGGCRSGALVSSFTAPPGSTGCIDPWSTRGVAGGLAYDYPHLSPDQARIRMQMAVPVGNQFDVPAGQEHFAFQLRIDHRRTTGTSACDGCATPVCIGWGDATVFRSQPLPSTRILGAATPDNGSVVTWQPGGVPTIGGFCPPFRNCESWVTCQSATPARNNTWGSIKSLYR